MTARACPDDFALALTILGAGLYGLTALWTRKPDTRTDTLSLHRMHASSTGRGRTRLPRNPEMHSPQLFFSIATAGPAAGITFNHCEPLVRR